MIVCDITTSSLLGTRCMQYTNIYKVKPNLCFWSKNVRTGCKRKDREWGRGGLATYVCNANEHGPPQLFLHCCAYGPRSTRIAYRQSLTCGTPILGVNNQNGVDVQAISNLAIGFPLLLEL